MTRTLFAVSFKRKIQNVLTWFMRISKIWELCVFIYLYLQRYRRQKLYVQMNELLWLHVTKWPHSSRYIFHSYVLSHCSTVPQWVTSKTTSNWVKELSNERIQNKKQTSFQGRPSYNVWLSSSFILRINLNGTGPKYVQSKTIATIDQHIENMQKFKRIFGGLVFLDV